MTEAEFLETAVRNGYATVSNVRDYMELHDAPYTMDDLQAVYRLDNYRETRDNIRLAQGATPIVREGYGF